MQYPRQEAGPAPADRGARPPPDGVPTSPGPESFDEIMPESPVTAEADFVPLPELGPADRTDLTAVDPYQADSLHAQAAFERAVDAAAQGDEALAIAEYLKASKIAETAREWYLAAVACHRVVYPTTADNYFAPKPGTMPPTQPVLEGARPWSHTCFTTTSLC
jgi:hypothetical protein